MKIDAAQPQLLKHVGKDAAGNYASQFVDPSLVRKLEPAGYRPYDTFDHVKEMLIIYLCIHSHGKYFIDF